MHSPSKKLKQSSLNQFYKKIEHHQNEQDLSYLSSTPKKPKSNIDNESSSKFVGRISPSAGLSRISNTVQECGELDLSSNMKLKLNDILTKHQNQKMYIQKLVQSPYKSHPILQSNTNQLLPQASDKMAKNRDQDESDFDYNLSVQPQQIKMPDFQKHQNKLSQFKLHDYDRQYSNFLVMTPENSEIKQFQFSKQNQLLKQTPKSYKYNKDKQPPTSQIIERIDFRNSLAQNSHSKNNQKPHSGQKSLNQPFSPENDKKIKKQPTNGKQFSIDNDLTQTLNNSILSDQDALQLMGKIKELESEVSLLKTHKYQFAIYKYRQDIRQELNKKLQKQITSLNLSYKEKQNGIVKERQTQISQFSKSIEDISKYKKTFNIILEQLAQTKNKIQQEHQQKIQQVKKCKQKLIHEWKRQSNEQIKKIVNNTHSKHSTRLSSTNKSMK